MQSIFSSLQSSTFACSSDEEGFCCDHLGHDSLLPIELSVLQAFRFNRCQQCHSEMCFHCGEGSWHLGLTCRQYLQQRQVDRSLCASEQSNLRWKLHHWYPNSFLMGSKQCPKCFVFISKERAGCNHMLCSYCGAKFCWQCRAEVTNDGGCAAYACLQPDAELRSVRGDELSTNTAGSSPRQPERPETPEAGVPDVRKLARLFNH